MNILLVDDNRYTLQGLLNGIDFEELGFTGVFTSYSAAGAKEILRQNRIEIVITDIEMPGGTGLELLEWINAQYPDIVTLFCTSYADFNYAQEAVRLHCFDYYLKPIKYSEFTGHLQKAIEAVRKRENDKRTREYGSYWLDNQYNIKADFWYKYLYRIQEISEAELREEIESRKLDYAIEEKFDICVIKLGRQIKERMLSEPIKSFIFKNISEEIFPSEFYSLEAVLITANNTMTVLLKKIKSDSLDLKDMCGDLLDSLSKYIARESNCYYREQVRLRDAKGAVEALEEISLDDISNDKKIINFSHIPETRNDFPDAVFTDWERLFRSKKQDQLIWKLDEYLRIQLYNHCITRQSLQEIRSIIVQLSCTVLKEKKIEAYKIFDDSLYTRLYTEAVHSVANMQEFARYVIQKSIEYMEHVEKSQTYVDKIARHIEENYNRNITRDELENIAFVNINQLSRVFKEKTGKTLHGYQMEIRITKAMELLAEGNCSVSEVALSVGYDNFSYFSRLFKNRTGVSPKEYRSAK